MDDLTARLDSLFGHYAAFLDQRRGDGVQLADQFRKDLHMLVAEYGQPAIDAALDELPDAASPSVSLHWPMRPLPTKTGLPRLDRDSWEKGFSDGFRGHVWWPGTGTEPLSYAAGYKEAQAGRDAQSRP
jgi:membrane carboxypeptidase/penicillin-binding protein PbpC